MPYPVLPPPPPPLVETIPSESISAEDKFGTPSNGENLGSGIVSSSASESVLSEPAPSTGEASVLASHHLSQGQDGQVGGDSIPDSAIAPKSSLRSSVAYSPSLTLATLEFTPPENFSPEFSSSEGGVVQASVTPLDLPAPTDSKSQNGVRETPPVAIAPNRPTAPSPRGFNESKPVLPHAPASTALDRASEAIAPEAEPLQESPQQENLSATLSESLPAISTGLSTERAIESQAQVVQSRQPLQELAELEPTPIENADEGSRSGISPLDVNRLLEEGAIAAQQRLSSSEASVDSSTLLNNIAAEESMALDATSSVSASPEDASPDAAVSSDDLPATTEGIPPLDVDRLLEEGLEGFRAQSVSLEAIQRTESLPSATEVNAAPTATRAEALGGRISIWPQSESDPAAAVSQPPARSLNPALPSSQAPQSNELGSPIGLSDREADDQAAAAQELRTAEALELSSEADAEALATAATQYYEFIKQDLDFASAQLIEPLGETFSALYDLAQEAVNDTEDLNTGDLNSEDLNTEDLINETEESINENAPDSFPTIPEPDGSDGEAAPIQVIPSDEAEEFDREESEGFDVEESLQPIDGLAEPEPDVETESETPEVILIPEPDEGSLLEPPAGPGPSGTPIDVAPGDVLELTSDRQTYDTIRRVFIADGNVELLVRGTVLNADRVQVNLPNKIAVAQGNVVLTRGQQVLRGDRIEYNLVSEEGVVGGARGEIFIPQIGGDTEVTRTDSGSRAEAPPLSGQLSNEQPPIETATTTGSLTIGIGSGSSGIEGGGASGNIRQLRFEADTIDFNSQGWEATNVRITNDPFSPPELEIRTDRATFRRLSPTRSELIASNPRLVFDQGFSLPLFRRRFVFDENQRDQGIAQFGFDREDRGGLYIERTFEPIVTPFATLSIRPQYFIQRALGGDTDDETASPDQDDNDGGLFDPDSFGLVASLDVDIDTRTSFEGRLEMTSLDLADFDDEGRGSVRLQRGVLPILHRGTRQPQFHTLTAEYSYRDRLFNGTLGFQTVQRTYGLVLTSPTIQLTGAPDSRGLELTYQAAIQRINANVAPDRRDDLLPPPPRDNVRTSLTRYQVAAELERFYTLWTGNVLPATPDEGLKYTPAPVVPFIAVIPRVQGVASIYSNGDTQPILTGELSLRGQFGNFSRPFLDYFGFNLSYERSTEGSESPFNFDRENDREVVSGGVTFQIYGPFRAGFNTSISLDEDEEFDNRFFLEYSRRTYGIVLSFNPDRETGSLTFRLSDFTWTGTPEPFGGSGVRTVEDSVVPIEPPAGSE